MEHSHSSSLSRYNLVAFDTAHLFIVGVPALSFDNNEIVMYLATLRYFRLSMSFGKLNGTHVVDVLGASGTRVGQ
jgi:hypothetical protein